MELMRLRSFDRIICIAVGDVRRLFSVDATMTPRIKRYVIGFGITALAVVVCSVVGVLYTAYSVSIHAEYALHAVNLTTVVVDRYVEREGKGPRSWDDLNTIIIDRWAMYSWPEDSQKVQACVKVEFGADQDALAHQSVEEFAAIKPIGACYSYKHDGHIAKLIETLKKNQRRPLGRNLKVDRHGVIWEGDRPVGIWGVNGDIGRRTR